MLDVTREPGRQFTERRKTGAGVLAALVVMAGGGQQGARAGQAPGFAGGMEFLGGSGEALRVEADVVAREQGRRAIAGGILHGLGGGRRTQLLEARQQLAAQAPQRTGRRLAQRLPAEPAFEMVEDRPVGFVEILAGRLCGIAEHLAILHRATAGPGVGTVDRKAREQLEQRAADTAQGQVAAGQVGPRHPQKTLGEVLQVTGEASRQDQLASLVDLVEKRLRASADPLPEFAQRSFAARIVLQQADLVHEVVAGGAVAQPILGQALLATEDLLNVQQHRRAAAMGADPLAAAAQASAIAARIGQAVDVIDAQAIEQTVLEQLEDLAVHGLEHLAALDPQADQFADVEETAPVDVVRRGAPTGQAVVLRLEQAVQALASLLVAFLEFAQRALEGCARSALGERSRQLTLHLAQGLAVLPALAETAGQG